MADYWIKLYTEIIDDPKMALLPDRLWRRVIEMFLLAKKVDQDGHLPDSKTIAWYLRLPDANELDADLQEISDRTGIIVRDGDGWFVVNFAKRQSRVTDSDRQRYSRLKKQRHEYRENMSRNVTETRHEPVTKCDTETEKETETEIETETETEIEAAAPAVLEREKREIGEFFAVYEREIGSLTPMIAEDLRDAIEHYPRDWIILAMQEAARQNKRSWKYCLAILKRWKAEGFRSDTRKNGSQNDKAQDLSLWTKQWRGGT